MKNWFSLEWLKGGAKWKGAFFHVYPFVNFIVCGSIIYSLKECLRNFLMSRQISSLSFVIPKYVSSVTKIKWQWIPNTLKASNPL